MRGIVMLGCAIALASCSKAGPPEPAPARPAADAAGGTNAPVPARAEIAYTYGYAFTLPARRIADVQDAHLALCDRLGPRCHVVAMTRASARGRGGTAGTELAVAADAARGFGDAMAAVVARAGGRTAERTIEGEDLGRKIVDVEARLRGRQALADRLLGIVQTHRGSIGDLVAAEKALADVQEEIDAARGELAEARGRVAMSTVRVSYAASAGFGDVGATLDDSVAGVGAVAASSLAALVTLLAALLPWLIPVGAIVLAARWWRRRGDRGDG